MYTEAELVKAAKVVRAKCLLFAFSPASNLYFYHHEKSLRYMCAVASATLVEYFKRMGIKACCYSTQRHCWVSVGDYFVDLTCSQYNDLGDFLVLNKEEFWKTVARSEYSRCYEGCKRVLPKDYKKTFSSWGMGQSPTNEVVKEIITIGEINV